MTYWERLFHLKSKDTVSAAKTGEVLPDSHVEGPEKTCAGCNVPHIEFFPNARLGPRADVPTYIHKAETAKSTLLEGSFGVRGPQLWNTLPSEVKLAPTMEILKSVLGKHLAGIPDWPPTTNYSTEHDNSLLEWAKRRGVR